MRKRHNVGVEFTPAEYALLSARAADAGLSRAGYLRRCINGAWLESGDEPVLVEERRGRHLTPAEMARVRTLAVAGCSTRLIADRLHIPRPVVYRWVRRVGLYAFVGHDHTPDHCAHISQGQRGRVFTAAHREHLCAAAKRREARKPRPRVFGGRHVA